MAYFRYIGGARCVTAAKIPAYVFIPMRKMMDMSFAGYAVMGICRVRCRLRAKLGMVYRLGIGNVIEEEKMKDTDYRYTLRRHTEDAPYFYDEEFTYDGLISFLTDEDEIDLEDVDFLPKEPDDWAYADDSDVWIFRMPKSVVIETWVPKFKKALAV